MAWLYILLISDLYNAHEGRYVAASWKGLFDAVLKWALVVILLQCSVKAR